MPADERTCREHSERLAKIEAGVDNLKTKVDELVSEMREGFRGVQETLDRHYVRREEYDPVRRLVYGLAGLMLAGIVVALIEVVIRRHGG